MLIKEDTESLRQKPSLFRYAYFILSGFRLKTYSQWKSAGEPNPFVSENYTRRFTSQQEIVDIFQDQI